ncbi:MAG TPA: hypothetical protein VJZ26_01525 [Blastocatellia bacterium]|nr:hypothetical protein [Blastocatellia bacterium]
MKRLVILRPVPARFAALTKRLGCLAAFLILGVIACPAQNPVAAEGWVVLPVDDYRALRQAAFPTEREPEPPPVDATLTRVDYDLKVNGDMASGEARLTIDVLKDGWVRVAIPGGLMIREARLDGKPVSLVTPASEKSPGASQLLLSRTGRSVLTLDIVAPVSSVAGTEMLRLPVSASAVSRAVLVVPGKSDRGVDAHVTGGLLLERSDTADGSRWVAHGRGNEPLTFAWRRRVEDQRAAQPLRLRAALTQLVGLGEDASQVNAEVQVEILQGIAKEIRAQLPDQFTVNQVSGATVADWEVTSNELIVTLLEPAQQTVKFALSGELRLPRDGAVNVPLIRLPAAERETGGVAVEVLGAGEIKDRQPAGLEEADATDLGRLISSRQSPSLVAFRLRPAEGKSSRSLSVLVARYTPQAVLTANVEEAAYSVLITEEGKMLVSSRLAVRNNQRNFLKFNLPSGAVLWSVSVAGRPMRPGRAPDGSLLVPLEKTRTGEESPAFAVEVAYLDKAPSWGEKGRARLSLLTMDMPISKSSLVLHYSPLFRLTPATGSFRVAPFQAPASATLRALPGATVELKESSGASTGDANTAQEMISRLQQSGHGSRLARGLPVRVAFPHFGPSIFLVSELTSENQAPVLEFDFQRDKKRGER